MVILNAHRTLQTDCQTSIFVRARCGTGCCALLVRHPRHCTLACTHSIDPRETNSNYGFNLPWWDWLLGTYIAQPAKGHEGMEIGVEQFRTRRDLWLDRMLIQPLRGPASGHALDPRITVKEPAE